MSAAGGPPPRLLVVGAGGVGKTTLAAALGVSFAHRGERTLVMTFDPSARLKDALGVAGEAARRGHVRVELEARGELWTHLLDAGSTFAALVDRYAPDPAARERILGNRFFRQLSGTLAGVLEYMAVERFYEALDGGGWDRIVLDTPPTREALDFLEAAERIVGFLDSGAIQLALRDWFDDRGHLRPTAALPVVGRGLDRLLDQVVGLGLLRDMVEFFHAFAPLYDGFRQRALEVDAALKAPETGFLLVTAPSERAVADAMFFARCLVERGHRLEAVVANRVHPAAPARPGLELMRWLGERDAAGVARLAALLGASARVGRIELLPASPVRLETLHELGSGVLSDLF